MYSISLNSARSILHLHLKAFSLYLQPTGNIQALDFYPKFQPSFNWKTSNIKIMAHFSALTHFVSILTHTVLFRAPVMGRLYHQNSCFHIHSSSIGLKMLFVSCNPTLTSFYITKKNPNPSFYDPANSKLT